MEKYSQFRDRGSSIAPFFPIPRQPSGTYLPVHAFIFAFRLFLLIPLCFVCISLSWLPFGALFKKPTLWMLLGVAGIWWVDLQIDGVRRGSLAKQPAKRLPHAGTIIASNLTSPLDVVYLSAIWNPIYTVSYPNSRLVRRISLFSAIYRAFIIPESAPLPKTSLVSLCELLAANPDRCVSVFPECTTTNGRGILRFSPSLLSTPSDVKILPVSLRWTPPDVTTPVSGSYTTFIWNLLSKPTHCIRVRLAEATYNTSPSAPKSPSAKSSSVKPHNPYETNIFDDPNLPSGGSSSETLQDDGLEGEVTGGEKRVLERVAEDLARLGRVKRVDLGVKEKQEFIKVWSKRPR